MAGRTVNIRYIPAEITVPANTPRTNPVKVAAQLGDVVLNEIRLTIPPGHHGLTGVQFQYASVPIVPWNDSDGWIIGDRLNEAFRVDFEVSSAMEVVAFNTDSYPHTFYVRFEVQDLPTVSTGGAVTIVPIA